MKRILKFVIIILVFLFISKETKGDSLNLEITFSKKVYLKGEPIWLDINLTNTSSDTVRTWGICLPCGTGFSLVVTDQKGDS